MRNDVREGVILHLMSDTKPNFAALAKRYNCDYRTVKRYYELGLENKLDSLKQERKSKLGLLDDFKALIVEKLNLGCSAKSIYYLICKKGYTGSYTTVKRFCRKEREDKIHKAAVRIEISPGLSAQVDWKESGRMISRHGEVFMVNLFLYVLRYSRMKYLQLTVDRNHKKVFECLHQAFLYTGGVPEEIWFDNMKTVVDRCRSQFTRVAFNGTFNYLVKTLDLSLLLVGPFGHKQREK
ncbi:conserved hypothetical protein (plasmid) [Enterococcus faecalis E1Sol]|nr:conserved hypothetical protein [Enterococcus faecalis E1Sol]